MGVWEQDDMKWRYEEKMIFSVWSLGYAYYEIDEEKREKMVGVAPLSRNASLTFVVVHTKSNAPDPIRTPKLSDFRHG